MNHRLELAVLSEQDTKCRFGLTLHNLNDHSLKNWSLCFSFGRFILPDSLSEGTIEQTGSFCHFTPEKNSPILANNHFYLEFSVNTAPFRYLSDGVIDAFILNGENQLPIPVDITSIALMSPCTKRSAVTECKASSAPIIPAPQSITYHNESCSLSHNASVSFSSSNAEQAAKWLVSESKNYQADFNLHKRFVCVADIRLITNPVLDKHAYHLKITPDQVTIAANSKTGFMYACASLLQLFPVQAEQNNLIFPCITIQDKPRFNYRGMMLDCSRHFHPVKEIKALINELAYYKFSTFHWHLTDDEGWRIEIKAFPELTKTGSWRGLGEALAPQFTHLDKRYGGYFTQEQIREIVKYADERAITIIPEIDIPGHCRAAIRSLPHLLVDDEDRSEYRSIQNYTDNVLNPALKGTYTFIDKVLEEVAALFPAPFVHIGADEVPVGVWVDSPICRQMMLEQSYTDPKELQGHLLRYAENKLKSLGKRMLGWEEACHGDKVSNKTAIYSWLNEEAALRCALDGFDVVLQPAQYTYFDMAQDFAPEEPGVSWACTLPLQTAYNYEPLADIPHDDPIREKILGIQCALWCEMIPDQRRLQYMLYPRLLAMAEVGWSSKQNRNWNNFLARLKGQLPRLDQQEIHYRNPWK